MMRKKRRDYSQIKYDDLPKVFEPGERKIIKSSIPLDQDCFRKTDAERERLKLAKSNDKGGTVKKHCRPCKRKRLHEFLTRKAEENQK